MAEVNKEESSKAFSSQEASTTIYDASANETTVKFNESFPLITNYPRPSMDYLLGRPLLFGTYQWKTTYPFGENIMGTPNKTLKLPSDLLKFEEVAQLLRYHNYFRPKVRLLVKVNGTPMHYGKLMCYYGYPDPTSAYPQALDSLGELHWLLASYNYKWAQISANSNQTLSMEAPYMAPFEITPVNLDQIDAWSFFKQTFDAGEFCIRVAVPLQINGEGNPSIDVSVFVIIDDLGRVGVAPGVVTPVSRFKAQGFDYGLVDDEPKPKEIIKNLNEAVQKTKGEILPSRIANDLGNWFGCFTKIPYIGFGAEIGKHTAKLTSTVLKYLGFSVPTNVQSITPTVMTQNRMYQMDDLVNSVVLAPTANSFVSKDISLLGSGYEDYDITSYCSHMMLYRNFEWRSDQESESVIFTTPIAPGYFCTRDVLDPEGSKTEVVTPTRLFFLQRLFDFWRGSLRFHLSLSASRFHSGRLRITWVPYYDKNVLRKETISDNYLAGYPSIILDLAGDTDVSFSVPYFQPNEWCNTMWSFNTDYHFNEPDFMINNGFLVVTVVNRLASNESTAISKVWAQMFVGGGPDLQFAMPNIDHQQGYLTKHPQTIPREARFQAQMAELSSDSLAKLDAKPIYPINSGMKDSHFIQSTDITSLKQLLNMGGPVFCIAVPASGTWEFTMWFNWSTSTICCDMQGAFSSDSDVARYNNTASLHNYAVNILPIKAMARGSYRVQFLVDDNYPTPGTETIVNYWSTGVPGAGQFNPDGCVSFRRVDPGGTYLIDQVNSQQGTHWFKRYSDQNIIVDVPYYGVTRATPALYPSEMSPPWPFVNGCLQFRRTFIQGQKVCINLQCGDDFQFAYDIMLPFIIDRIPPIPAVNGFSRSLTAQSHVSNLDFIQEEDPNREEDPF